jgi:hypothetical protein
VCAVLHASTHEPRHTNSDIALRPGTRKECEPGDKRNFHFQSAKSSSSFTANCYEIRNPNPSYTFVVSASVYSDEKWIDKFVVGKRVRRN